MYGGKSSEYEVSCRSAEFVRKNLADQGFRILDIKVDRHNRFDIGLLHKSDVIFPVIHGTYGEDGSLQGMLEMLGKPYVGAGVLGSAVGMDKEVQKRLLSEAGVSVARYIRVDYGRSLKAVEIPFRFPVFVKPANCGSSVGVMKVKDRFGIGRAIERAFKFDTKVLVEEEVVGREMEVAVWGDALAGYKVEASLPGEVIPAGKHEFYDYEAKYVDEKGAILRIPAGNLNPEITDKIRKLAVKTFEVLNCSGIARVDMFLCFGGNLVVNEINTLPGFTKVSMYPKLWTISGVTEAKLLDQLIKMAVERWKIKDRLRRENYQ